MIWYFNSIRDIYASPKSVSERLPFVLIWQELKEEKSTSADNCTTILTIANTSNSVAAFPVEFRCESLHRLTKAMGQMRSTILVFYGLKISQPPVLGPVLWQAARALVETPLSTGSHSRDPSQVFSMGKPDFLFLPQGQSANKWRFLRWDLVFITFVSLWFFVRCFW